MYIAYVHHDVSRVRFVHARGDTVVPTSLF